MRYPSLFEYKNEAGNKVFCILFGLLALVNSDEDEELGFSNYDVANRPLNWRSSYFFGQKEENIGMEETVTYNIHDLSVNSEYESEGGFFLPFNMDLDNIPFQRAQFFGNEKVIYIMRVKMIGFSAMAEVTRDFPAGRQVKLAYPWYYNN